MPRLEVPDGIRGLLEWVHPVNDGIAGLECGDGGADADDVARDIRTNDAFLLRTPPAAADACEVGVTIELADEAGVDALTMRTLGARLGVEAMSLYNHVSNKDDVLSGMTDLVWAQIDLAPGETDWRPAVRTICVSVHEAFLRHPWSCRLHATSAGVARLRYIDRTLMHLRTGGFSADVTYHAHHLLDGYVLGYTLQMIDYSAGDQGASDAVQELVASVAAEMPWFMEHMGQHMADDVPGVRFEIGLDQILDGLERGRSG